MEAVKIDSFIESALDEMERRGATADYIRKYKKTGFGEILLYFKQIGQDEYSAETIDEFVNQARLEYARGDTSRWRWGIVRRGSALLNHFHDYGTLDLERQPPWTSRRLGEQFSVLVERFCTDIARNGNLKESTLRQNVYYLRPLLFKLEDMGINAFTELSPLIVSECATHIAGRYQGGVSGFLAGIRRFLKYLHLKGETGVDLSSSLPEFAATHRRFRPGFSAEEADSVLNAADTSTVIGKRNYAMMLLAAQTGLRGCDVVNLKRGDIDWRANEVKIVQSKTNVSLGVSLPAGAGNAIADYLLNARPDCDEPFVFLTTDLPYRRLRRITGIAERHIKRAGLVGTVSDRSGFHSFRRSLGKSLLESETSLDMLAELLGHTDMDSMKPYLAIDENGLKQCALGLIPASTGGDSE